MKHIFLVTMILAIAASAGAATIIETEPAVAPRRSNTLATCAYKARQAEQPFLQKIGPEEAVTGSFMKEYSIHGKKGVYVSWFAIVRGITKDPGAANRYRLLLEQKYFDSMTDCHIMLVAAAGDGDFTAGVNAAEAQSIPLLSLVRIYGKVLDEPQGQPVIEAEYIRVFPWLTFTLTDLSPKDHGNPKWRKLCELCSGGRIYEPFPDESYYLKTLGNPKDFAAAEPPKPGTK